MTQHNLTLADVVMVKGKYMEHREFVSLNNVGVLFAPEIQKLRFDNPRNKHLRDNWFVDGTRPVYDIKPDSWMLYLVQNPKLDPINEKNVSEIINQISRNGYHFDLSDKDLLSRIVDASSRKGSGVTAINMENLGLQALDQGEGKHLPVIIKPTPSYMIELGYLEFGTKRNKETNKYCNLKTDNPLNDDELKLVTGYMGKGKDLDNSMGMLAKADIQRASIYVLNPRKHISRKLEGNAVGCLSGFFPIGGRFKAYACLEYCDTHSFNGLAVFALSNRKHTA